MDWDGHVILAVSCHKMVMQNHILKPKPNNASIALKYMFIHRMYPNSGGGRFLCHCAPVVVYYLYERAQACCHTRKY